MRPGHEALALFLSFFVGETADRAGEDNPQYVLPEAYFEDRRENMPLYPG